MSDKWIVKWRDIKGRIHDRPFDTENDYLDYIRSLRDNQDWDGKHLHVIKPKRKR